MANRKYKLAFTKSAKLSLTNLAVFHALHDRICGFSTLVPSYAVQYVLMERGILKCLEK